MKKLLIILISLVSVLKSQTNTQSRGFINRTHISIMKVEKEMYIKNDTSNVYDFRKSIACQMASLNLYKQNKFKEAVTFSLLNIRNTDIQILFYIKVSLYRPM